MNKTDKSMNISGINSMYNGCQVKLNGTVIGSSFSGGTCSVPSRTYNQYNDKLDITLLKPTNVVPNATIKDVVNLTYGQLLPWTVEATDANGNLQSSGIYIHQGTPAIGVTTNWTRLKWVGGQNTSAMTFRHSDTGGVTPWTCNAGNQGTWTLSTNAVDTAGLQCSGDPTGSATGCASGLS